MHEGKPKSLDDLCKYIVIFLMLHALMDFGIFFVRFNYILDRDKFENFQLNFLLNFYILLSSQKFKTFQSSSCLLNFFVTCMTWRLSCIIYHLA